MICRAVAFRYVFIARSFDEEVVRSYFDFISLRHISLGEYVL